MSAAQTSNRPVSSSHLSRALGPPAACCEQRGRLIGLIAISTLVRVIYDAMVNPRNALDSLVYHDIAAGIASHGPASPKVPFLPYYPGGYSALIAGVYEITGPEPAIARLVSLALLAVTIYVAWHLIARELGERLAWLVAFVLAFSPALTGVSSVLSYEPLLGALAVIAVDQVSRALRSSASPAVLHAAAAGAALGYGFTVQSKLIVVGFVVGLWLAHQTRRLLLPLALVLLALPAPVMYALRNEHVYGRLSPSLSTNSGAVMVTGFNDQAKGIFVVSSAIPSSCRPDHHVRFWRTSPFESDRRLRSCALRWARSHLGALPLLELRKLLYFFGPSVGPRGSATYMHRLDPRDLLPERLTASSVFERADGAIRTAWALAAIASLLAGFALLWRSRRGFAAVSLGIVAGFALVTLVTVGDARYSYPIATFSAALQGLCVLWLLEQTRARRSRR